MPDGIYLSTDSYQNLQGDLFAQSAHGQIADTWAARATAALPDLVQQQQAAADAKAAADAQAQREAAAQAFESHASDLLAQHLGSAAPAPSGSDPTAPPVVATDPTTPAVPPDLPAIPTAPLVPPPTAPPPTQQPITPPVPVAPPPTETAVTAPLVAPVGSPAPTQRPIGPVAVTPTTAGLSGGGDVSGRVGAGGLQIMASGADSASWLGADGQKALQAVLLTEGGLAGARGDNGKSAGPLQFFEGGQLANFAAQHNLTTDQAKTYVENNPEAAIAWAIGTPDRPGYLGAAIQAGQKQGLSGADLATYAQQHGQVSVSPERAGQNWTSMFGGGQDVVSGSSTNTALRMLNTAVSTVASAARPSQFASGLSDADAYAACGPVAALAFARATGRNPTAQESLDLAKSVGWTQAQGMAGPSSEVDLLKKLGVTSHLEGGADPAKIATDVANGNPVIISTAGHYFVADGARTNDDGSQSFHVGTSGTDLKRGSEWMSLGQMSSLMGEVQGTLYLDRQPGDGPSVAVQANAQSSAPPTETTAPVTAPLVAPPSMTNASPTLTPLTSGLTAPGVPPVVNPVVGAPLVAPPGMVAPGAPLALTPASSPVGNAANTLGSILPALNLPQPDAGTPLARSLAGLPLSGPEQLQAGLQTYQGYQAARDQATSALNPARDVPVLGGVINSLTDPLMFTTGIDAANLAAKGGTALAKGLPAVADLAGGLAGHLAAPVATDVADTAGHVIGGTLGQGQASVTLATHLGGAAAGGGAAYEATDPNDPNRILKIGAGAVGGALAAGFVGSAVERFAKGAGNPALAAARDASSLPAAAAPLPGTPEWTKWAAAGGKMSDATPQAAHIDPPPGWFERFKAYHVANVISGGATAVHVIANSMLAPAWSVTTHSASDLVRAGAGVLTHNAVGTTDALGGVQGRLLGLGTAFTKAGSDFADALFDFYADPQNIANRETNPLAQKGWQALQATGSALHSSFQGIAQNAVRDSELGMRAGEQAWSQGLKGHALANHVADALANPPADWLAAATDTGRRAALQGEAGTLQKGMEFIAKLEPITGNVLFPVVKIAAQSIAQGVEKSPLGLAGTGWDVARATALHSGPYWDAAAGAANYGRVGGAVSPLADRLINNVAGTALTFWMMSKTADGTITGTGPTDPSEMKRWEAEGWAPHSVYIPGRGYVDYHILGPLAVPLALAGAYADAMHPATTGHPDPTAQDRAGTAAQSMANYFYTNTGLQTIGNVAQILKGGGGPGRALASIAGSTLGGMIPDSGLLRTGTVAADPLTRTPDMTDLGQGVLQTAEAGVPILRGNVPIKRDQLGTPIDNPQQGWGALAPRTKPQGDPVFKMLTDADVNIPDPPATVAINSHYSVALTSDEQQKYLMMRGQYLQQLLGQLQADPSWSTATAQQQKPFLQRYFAQIDAKAKLQVVSEIPNADLMQRIAADQGLKAQPPGVPAMPGR